MTFIKPQPFHLSRPVAETKQWLDFSVVTFSTP